MKGKKCFIKLGVILISLFVGVVINGNPANALMISNLRRDYINNIDFKTYTPNHTYNAQPLNQYVYTPVYSATVQPGANFRASSLVIHLDSSFTFQEYESWDLTLYLYSSIDSYRGLNGDTLIPSVLCPGFSNDGNMIDTCDVRYNELFNSPIELYPISSTTPDILPAAFYSKIHGYYSIKLKGHFTASGSGNTMNLSAPFLSVFNPTNQALNFDYVIGFSQFRLYSELPDDAQDRENLENQQEETGETAEDQEEEATTTGQTLFSAFSSLVSALGNVHQTNCKLPNMSVYTITLDNMDLCSVNLPNGVSALAGIAMCFIIVKMGISLVHRMLNLYKEIIG